jgi:hypothetical protein
MYLVRNPRIKNVKNRLYLENRRVREPMCIVTSNNDRVDSTRRTFILPGIFGEMSPTMEVKS